MINVVSGFNSAIHDEFEDIRQRGLVSDSSEVALKRYFESGWKHKSYKHYGTREKIALILKNKELYLSDGSNWNDRQDGNNFNSPADKFKHFGICFSWSQSESIAMWMLYGGRGKDGAMIDFTSQSLLPPNNAQITLGRREESGFLPFLSLPFHEVYLDMMDILYIGSKDEGRRQSNLKLHAAGQHGTLAFKREASDFLPKSVIKSRAWEYEQEVRLIASVPKQVLGADATYITHLRLPLNSFNIESETKVYRSPLCDVPKSYMPSMLEGTVNWDLCYGCNMSENGVADHDNS